MWTGVRGEVVLSGAVAMERIKTQRMMHRQADGSGLTGKCLLY